MTGLRKLTLAADSPRAEHVELEIVAAPPKPERVARRSVPAIDFASVLEQHWGIHARLENWARWCRGTQRQDGAPGSPMFALYRTGDYAQRRYGDETPIPVDRMDAAQIAKAVAVLPDRHRQALQWCYLHPRNPAGFAKSIGATMQGLHDLIRDGRQMLVNKRA